MACSLNQTYFEIMVKDAECCDWDYVPPAAEEEHHRRLGGSTAAEEEESTEESSHDTAPFYKWKDLTDIQAILGHPLMYESHGHNYSHFSDYDNIILLELYMSKVVFPRRRLGGGAAPAEEEYQEPVVVTPPTGAAHFTLQTLAFTFNNREVSVIEMQKVSKYTAPTTYYILMSCILFGFLVVAIGIPVTLALNDSYQLAELINRRRFPPNKDEAQIKKAKELGIVLKHVSGFEIFVQKHLKRFLGIG
jgi:hypothetical protein